MQKNILFINSSDIQVKNSLFDFFEELKLRGYQLTLLTSSHEFAQKFQKQNWQTKKIKRSIEPESFFLKRFLFILFLPLTFLGQFIFCLYHKQKLKIQNIICFNTFEKITITPVAKILKINVVWFEYPDFDYQLLKKRKFLKFFYVFFSRFTKIICFTESTKDSLVSLKISHDNINKIPFGIKTNQHQHQDNIFNKIADSVSQTKNKKFFTIGTVIDLNKKQKVEILFKAIKTCLSVISDLQIIIVGDGEERKNLTWLSKKMEINDMIWFVGEQNHLRKWLDTFDIFVSTFETININDVNVITKTSAAGIPIIATEKIGLESIVENKVNGIVIERDNSEILAQNIIKLYKNKDLRKELGQQGKTQVDKYFLLVNMVDKLENILK